MTRMGVRVALILLLCAGIGAAGWQYYRLEVDGLDSHREVQLLDGFRDQVARGVTAARTAQQAYVAPGQGLDVWQTQFAEAIADMTEALENLRATAGQAAEPIAALDTADRALKVYDGLDRKVRAFVHADNLLMATDVVYEDGIKTSSLIISGVDDAHRLLASPHQAAIGEHRRQQQYLAWGSAGAALLLALVLLPVGRRAEAEPVAMATGGQDSPDDDLHLVQHEAAEQAGVATPMPSDPGVPPPSAATRVVSAGAATPPPTSDAGESLAAAALVCTDLARVKDGDQLREALGRAARVLDASGVIVWIGDSTGRSLKPLLTYGYPEEALRRIPTLPRDADNATAAAWREGALMVVDATESAPGAIAVPILGPQGCLGVLAAEIGHHQEATTYTKAVAQIVAAQLAVLIPPESASES